MVKVKVDGSRICESCGGSGGGGKCKKCGGNGYYGYIIIVPKKQTKEPLW